MQFVPIHILTVCSPSKMMCEYQRSELLDKYSTALPPNPSQPGAEALINHTCDLVEATYTPTLQQDTVVVKKLPKTQHPWLCTMDHSEHCCKELCNWIVERDQLMSKCLCSLHSTHCQDCIMLASSTVQYCRSSRYCRFSQLSFPSIRCTLVMVHALPDLARRLRVHPGDGTCPTRPCQEAHATLLLRSC
jgi:hypothetical protein